MPLASLSGQTPSLALALKILCLVTNLQLLSWAATGVESLSKSQLELRHNFQNFSFSSFCMVWSKLSAICIFSFFFFWQLAQTCLINSFIYFSNWSMLFMSHHTNLRWLTEFWSLGWLCVLILEFICNAFGQSISCNGWSQREQIAVISSGKEILCPIYYFAH